VRGRSNGDGEVSALPGNPGGDEMTVSGETVIPVGGGVCLAVVGVVVPGFGGTVVVVVSGGGSDVVVVVVTGVDIVVVVSRIGSVGSGSAWNAVSFAL
jgi:hypothetical protein